MKFLAYFSAIFCAIAKILGYFMWSWWLVFAPTFVGIALLVFLIAIVITWIEVL